MAAKRAPQRTPVAFIGMGNMGGAIAQGLFCRQDVAVVGTDLNLDRLKALEKQGLAIAADAAAAAKAAKYVVLAVKPQGMAELLAALAPRLSAAHCLISIAAGVTLEKLKSMSRSKSPVVRVMPNTPAMVGAGVFALCLDDPALGKEQKEFVTGLFTGLGQVHLLAEKYFDAFTALAGCGPAYVYYVMEALVEAAVSTGLPRPDATAMTKALFTGSAKLAECSPLHLSQLREMVTSPGGATIAATAVLDRQAVRGAFIDAVVAAKKRSEELG